MLAQPMAASPMVEAAGSQHKCSVLAATVSRRTTALHAPLLVPQASTAAAQQQQQ